MSNHEGIVIFPRAFSLHALWRIRLLNTVFKPVQPAVERRAPVLNKSETVGMKDVQTFKPGKLWGPAEGGALHPGNAVF